MTPPRYTTALRAFVQIMLMAHDMKYRFDIDHEPCLAGIFAKAACRWQQARSGARHESPQGRPPMPPLILASQVTTMLPPSSEWARAMMLMPRQRQHADSQPRFLAAAYGTVSARRTKRHFATRLDMPRQKISPTGILCLERRCSSLMKREITSYFSAGHVTRSRQYACRKFAPPPPLHKPSSSVDKPPKLPLLEMTCRQVARAVKPLRSQQRRRHISV